ncbi:MAG: phage terminase large subunit [Clostridia bacterium]|nr:phage terminase large subunit [Clostridia bacterium]
MSKVRVVLGRPNNEKQEAFLAAKVKHVGYGGARGGGKSWVVRDKAKRLCLHYPGIKTLVIRRTYPELVNNHVTPLKKDIPIAVAKYNKTDKEFWFRNGSTIKFGYCNNEGDLLQYQGAEYDVIFIDEATQLPELWVKEIVACCRGVNNFPKRVYYTMNPGGASHGYFKRIFIDRKYEKGENPSDYFFIQALVTDNKALMKSQPEYIQQLEALPPKLRKAWLEGDWDIFEGQFFEEFTDRPENYHTKQWTHVIKPFDIPDGWKIYRSFDWGYNKPFSCGWWAVDYDGVIYRILELYGCKETPNEGVKWTPPQVFAEIHRIETEHRWLRGKKIQGIADPAIWDAETGESIAEVAAKHQVYFTPGDHKRLPGWMQVHYRLCFDENGFPMMYIFDNCKAFIRTIPLLQYDEHRVEDLDSDGEDHVADEVRYFCMSRPIKPRIAAKKDSYSSNPLNLFLDIKKEDLSTTRSFERMQIISED